MKTVFDMYEDFCKECWKAGVSDVLLSTIVGIDHSTLAKRRNQLKITSSCSRANKYYVRIMFDIISKPEYIHLAALANPLKTKGNVNFWESHPDLFDYYMLLRDKLLNKESDNVQPNVDKAFEETEECRKSINLGEHKACEDCEDNVTLNNYSTKEEEIEDLKEVKNSGDYSVEECAYRPATPPSQKVQKLIITEGFGDNFKDLKPDSVEFTLRSSVLIAIMQGKYQIADEILSILRTRFES